MAEFYAVIGKNFGDEGKGMATDYLCLFAGKNLCVRANGGAQSGHTVDALGKSFVFHELSSGSFRRADTYWAGSYHPDLYKLSEEIENFKNLTGFEPVIYASLNASITIIDDILINMALETNRGEKRHGSCGMGIYEAELRAKAGFRVPLSEVFSQNEESLIRHLMHIREVYLPLRLKEENLSLKDLGEYGELLSDFNVLANFVAEIKKNLKYVRPVNSDSILFEKYDRVIFENGQGLLLDGENERFLPNVTASRTGLDEISKILKSTGNCLNEVLYVTRSYVTRHGAGFLPCECEKADIGENITDRTNEPNDWQGCLRYAFHESEEAFLGPVIEDLKKCKALKASLFITHLNETEGKLLFKDEAVTVAELLECPAVKGVFDNAFLSSDRHSENVKKYRHSESIKNG